MKRLHRRDLWCWSIFAQDLDIDINAFLWTRSGGNILVDPLPMSAHDRAHLAKLGGAAWIVITNRDHVRGARELAAELGCRVAGPAADRGEFPMRCDAWLSEREPLFEDWRVFELDGSRTPVLAEPPAVANDRIVLAERAQPRHQIQRRYPGSLLSLLSGSEIKRITAGVRVRR